MSSEAILTMISVVCAVISIACFDFVRRALKRRAKAREEEQRREDLLTMQKRINEMKDRVAVAMAAAVGQVPIRQCHAEDIKYGDTVCWPSEDWQQHTDYVAGFDGDTGPSPEGFHGKPIVVDGGLS